MVDSLYRRAMSELRETPKSITEIVFGPEYVRTITIEVLRRLGANLFADPATTQMLIKYAEPDVAAGIRDWEAEIAPQRRGRPPNDFLSVTILAAALCRFQVDGVSRASACLQAAKWLGGSPVTSDQVDKNERAFKRQISAISKILPAETAWRIAEGVLRAIASELEAIQVSLDAEKVGESARRKESRHASFSA